MDKYAINQKVIINRIGRNKNKTRTIKRTIYKLRGFLFIKINKAFAQVRYSYGFYRLY
jgi:hypothetical protein